LAVIVAAASSLMAADAPNYRGGANHPGTSSEAIDLTGGGSALTLAYSMSTGTSPVVADPIVIEGKLIVANTGGDVICLNLATGSTAWTRNVGAPVRGTPSATNGRVFVGTTSGTLHALSLVDGTPIWTVTHGGQMFSSPVLVGDRLLVTHGFGNDNLTSYDVATGAVIWNRLLTRFSQASPAVYGDKVVAVTPDGLINAFSLVTGEPAWPEPVEAGGIFFGTAPCIALDPDSTNVYVFCSPGDDEVLSGGTITGFQGYATYRINLATGIAVKLAPGVTNTTANLVSRSARNAGTQGPQIQRSSATGWMDCPHDLKQELASLSHFDSMILVIEEYERNNGIDLGTLKQGLRDEVARAASYKATTDAEIASGTRSAKGIKNAVPLPASNLVTTWPTAGQCKPGPVAYLAPGNGRFMVVMLRETPTTSVTPRTFLFCLNPAMGGAVRWMYVTDQLPVADTPASQGALLVPKATDPNGAYVFAPLGHSVGIFDAGGSNTPITQIDMTAPVYSTPVVANGKVIVIDTAGHLKVFNTSNDAPSVPVITAPSQNQNLTVLANPTATWSASTDDTTAPAAISYVVRYAVDVDFVTAYTEVTVAAGQTSYHWPSLVADSMVTFAVRAVDGQGAASAFSEARTFTYLLDSGPPAPPGVPTVGQGALSLTVNFAASPDQAPNGAADVSNYRLTITNTATNASFIVNLGLSRSVVVNGALPATPLEAGVTYSVSLVAMDKRGNISTAVSATGIPLPPAGTDITPPEVLTAALTDTDGNGAIDRAILTFSEPISFNTGDLQPSGFALDGLVAVGTEPGANPSQLMLTFGAGVAGTGLKQLTFDPLFGTVKDLAGLALAAIGENDLIETDIARPILLVSTIQAHDDNADGVPNRVTVNFSEAMDPTSVQLADVASVVDSVGTALVATSVSLLPGNVTIEIVLNGTVGVMGTPSVSFADNGDSTFLRDPAGNPFAGEFINLSPVIVVTPAVGLRDVQPGLVVLDASGSSDPDAAEGSALSFDWRILAGPGAALPTFRGTSESVLSGTTHSKASFLAVEPGLYTIQLTVSDNLGGMASENLLIRVLNVAPVAVAGADRSVTLVAPSFALDGRRSTDANSTQTSSDIVLHSWTVVSKPAGPDPLFDNPTALRTTVPTAGLAVGIYVFRLTVFDRANQSSTDDVTIRLFDSTNLPPSAKAGPDRRIALGQPVRLDGRFSRDDSPLNYVWAQVAGPPAPMGNANTARSTAVATAAGIHVFRLTVSDGFFESSDEVTIEVFDTAATSSLPAPVVSAPTQATAGTEFVLDAAATLALPGVSTASPPLIDMVQVSGPRLFQVAGGTGATRTYVALTTGLAIIDAWTTDGARTSLPIRLAILVRSASNAPTTIAFSQLQTAAGSTLTFDFSQSSDEDADTFAISLVQVAGPSANELFALDDTSYTFNPTLSGTYEFEASAFDGVQFSAPYRFSYIHAPAGSRMPVATPSMLSLSADSRVATLTATNVSDPDGDAVGFLWVQTGGPTATIADDAAQTTAVDLIPGTATYAFDLYADDGTHQVKAGSVSFSTIGTPGGGGGGAAADGGGCAAIAGSGRVWLPLAAAMLAVMGLLVLRRRRAV